MEAAARALELLGDAECPSSARGLGPGMLCGPTGARSQLLELAARVWISGSLAWVEVRARYATTPAGPGPLTYKFPLSPRARLNRFRAQVAGKVMDGRLQDRARALQAYQAVVSKGQPATLVDQAPDLLQLDCGTVPPGAEVAIDLAYVETLELNAGEQTFLFPLVDEGGQLPANVSIVTMLETAGVPPARLAASQPTSSQTSQRGDYRIDLGRPNELKPRDFALKMRLGAEQPRVQLFAGEGHYHVGILPPKNTVPSPSGVDVVFLLDRSQAMAGERLEGARKALSRALGNLGDRDRFAIWAYNESLAGPSGGRLTGPAERAAAQEWLKTLAPAGTADLHKVLEQLRAVPATVGRTLWLVLITGSGLPQPGELVKAAQARPLPGRLFGFSLAAENEIALRLLSERCRGRSVSLRGDQLESAVEQLVTNLRQPVAFELELQDQGLAPVADSQVPDRMPDLVAATPVSAVGRKSGQGGLALQLKLPHEASVRTAKIAPFPSKNPALAAGWAALRLAHLEDQRALASNADQARLTQEMSELSLQSGVLGQATALVVLDLQNVAHVHVLREGGEAPAPVSETREAPAPASETRKLPPLPPLELPDTEPAPAPPAPKAQPAAQPSASPSVPRDRGLTIKSGVNQGNRLTAKSVAGKKIGDGAKAQFTRQKPPGSDRAKIDSDHAAKLREKHKDKLDIGTSQHEIRRLVHDDSMEKQAGEVDPRFESVWTYGPDAPVGVVPGSQRANTGEPKNLRQQFLDRLEVVGDKLDRLRRQPSRAHAEPLAEELYYSLGMLEEAVKTWPNLEPMLVAGQDLYRALLNANPAVIDGLQKWLDQWRTIGA